VYFFGSSLKYFAVLNRRVALGLAEYKIKAVEKEPKAQIEDFNFPFSTSAENFYININLLPSGFEY